MDRGHGGGIAVVALLVGMVAIAVVTVLKRVGGMSWTRGGSRLRTCLRYFWIVLLTLGR